MLLNFRISNFLSFNQEVEFSMLAGQVKQSENHVSRYENGRVSVLKGAVVYGANASGKSNLIKAISFAQKIITKGPKQTYSRQQHFRLEAGAEDRSSKFEFELQIGEKSYAYGFVLLLKSRKVKEEWLFEVKKQSDKAVFERMVKKDGTSEFKSKPNFRGSTATRFGVYSTDISDEKLLITELQDKPGKDFSVFHKIFGWFDKQLSVFYPESKFFGIEEMAQDDKSRDEFCDYLKYFKTGIEGIDSTEGDVNEMLPGFPDELKVEISDDLDRGSKPVFGLGEKRFAFSKNEHGDIVVNRLLTRHKMKNSTETVNFDFEDESDGNRRIFDLIPLLLMLETGPITVFIDEIDRSLHPELTRRLLEIFFQKNHQPGSQLILTTHESSLLDLTLLRRDEIWFAEKNSDGESRLYSLEEFKPRFDTEIRKAYLQGRFGAIPFIADISQLGWIEN